MSGPYQPQTWVNDNPPPLNATRLTNIEAGIAGASSLQLIPTSVKTGSYTAAPDDFVPVDTTSANVIIALPAAPADKTCIGLKMVAQGGTNTVTVNTGGSDVINIIGGVVFLTLSMLNQAVILQYKASNAIWYVLSSDVPLGQLDARYLLPAGTAAGQELTWNGSAWVAGAGDSGGGGGSTTGQMYALSVQDYGAVANNVTDSAPAFNSALLAPVNGKGWVYCGQPLAQTGVYSWASPVVIQDGCALKGQGGRGATKIRASSSFPNTTISGTQTTPSVAGTVFTLTCSGGTGPSSFASGAVNTPCVLCVNGITITYTGTTSTTFTGCTSNYANVTLTNGTPVSTFMVFLTPPSLTAGGFGCRLEGVNLDGNNVPGIGGVYSCHVQEHGGVFETEVQHYMNFGLCFEPHSAGVGQAAQNFSCQTMTLNSSSSAPAYCVGISARGVASGATFCRGIQDFTMTGPTSGLAQGNVAIIIDGMDGVWGRSHFENWGIGYSIGPNIPVTSLNLQSPNGGSPMTTVVRIENTAGQSLAITGLRRGGATNAIVDLRTDGTAVPQTLTGPEYLYYYARLGLTGNFWA